MTDQLFLRADSNPQIGSGHLVRSLALGQAWESLGGRAVLVTSSEPNALPSSVQLSDLELIFVPLAHPDPGDLSRMKSLLNDHKSAWISCDGYHFDASYTSALRSHDRWVLVIDDIAHAHSYCADIILNQNIHSERLLYRCEVKSKKLLGPRYALLRREFASWYGWRRTIPPSARHVLVTMGGGDPFSQTRRVVRALERFKDDELEVKVILGCNDGQRESLEAEAKGGRGVRFELLQNPPDIPALLAWADVAISAGGSTCWELCFLGVPSLLMTFADNQAGITNGLAEARAAVHLGWFYEVSERDIGDALRSLLDSANWREALSRHGQALVDGHGATRVVRTLRGESEDGASAV